MKIHRKLMAAGAIAALAVCVNASVLAAEVEGKAYKEGSVVLEVPVVKGSIGGAAIDSKINKNIENVMLESISGYFGKNSVKEILSVAKDNGIMKKAAEKTNEILKAQMAEGGWHGYYLDFDSDVEFKNDYFVSILQKSHIYTGGAHPNHRAHTFNFDLKTGEEIQLANLFVEGSNYQERLEKLLYAWQKGEKRFANYHNKINNRPLLSEDVPQIKITGNEKYYINDDKELVLIFDPYEIASYAEGFKKCEIPLSLLGDILKL